MMDNLVTIAIYGDPIEAKIAKSKLESEGIYCFITNDELMSTPTLRTVIGQVELQVKSSDVQKAQKILGLK